jgi:hypothetical protein
MKGIDSFVDHFVAWTFALHANLAKGTGDESVLRPFSL